MKQQYHTFAVWMSVGTGLMSAVYSIGERGVASGLLCRWVGYVYRVLLFFGMLITKSNTPML